jgi:hypothetical protein
VRGARRALLACLALVLVASAACSLVLDVDAKQCVVDGDCARFGDAVCAPGGVCVARAVACNGGACWSCPPATNIQFHNACTDAQCVSFDAGRLTKLEPDGGLPPLP